MNVKVKVKVVKHVDMYDYSTSIVAKYTYKAEGFKRESSLTTLVYQHHGEGPSEYDKRLLKELRLLTKEEVIQIVKSKVVNSIMYKIASSSTEEETKRLLKELNGIKFSFNIKDKL